MDTSVAPSTRLRKLSGFEIQWRVTKALVYRELRRRISEADGGFLTVLIEPMGQVMIWTSLRYIVSARTIVNNLNIVLFLAAGVIPFSIYARIASYGLTTMEANKALFFYKRVKPIDTILARAVEELGVYSCSAILIFSGIWIFTSRLSLSSLPLLVMAFILISLLGISSSLLSLIGVHYFVNLKQVFPWFNRILYFASGVLFAPIDLPQYVREWLVYNPILQCLELARQSLSVHYQVPDGVRLDYPLFFTTIYLSISLWVYTNNERHLLRR